jgi:hypothetical protein
MQSRTNRLLVMGRARRGLLAFALLTCVIAGLSAVVSSALARSVKHPQPPKGLVSWYQADRNAKDSQGHNNGTLHGGVSYAAGDPGEAFSFDGSTGYVSVGDPSALRSDGRDFTIAARVWFASNVSPSGSPSQPCHADGGPGCDMSIVTKMAGVAQGSTPNSNGWRLVKQSDNHVWFCFGAGGNGCLSGSTTTAISTTAVVPHRWYEIVGVYSQTSGISIYVDGQLQDTVSGAGAVDDDTAPMLFGYYPGESFLWGRLNEIQYFNKSLTAAQIRALPN